MNKLFKSGSAHTINRQISTLIQKLKHFQGPLKVLIFDSKNRPKNFDIQLNHDALAFKIIIKNKIKIQL